MARPRTQTDVDRGPNHPRPPLQARRRLLAHALHASLASTSTVLPRDPCDGKSRCGEGDVLSVPALHKNGTTTSVEFTVMPLKNESGAMIGMAAMMRDVTKRFEETRALKQRLAEATTTASPDRQ